MEKVNDLNGTVQALKSTLPVIELNPDFVCKTANEKALKLFGLSRIEVRSKSMMDFIAHQYYTPWNHVKNEILNTDFTTLTIPFQVGPDIVNYAVSISVIRNLEGKVSKLILLLVHEIKDKVPAFSTL
jgi:hypothetical protein